MGLGEKARKINAWLADCLADCLACFSFNTFARDLCVRFVLYLFAATLSAF